MNIMNILRFIKYLPQVIKFELPWIMFETKHSNKFRTKEARKAELLVSSHVLEKGLTMPNRRLGFGQERVQFLIKSISDFIRDYDAESLEVQFALDDIAEYLYIHTQANYALPEKIVCDINKLLKYRKSGENIKSISCDRDTFFPIGINFKTFAYSRRSSRHYANNPVDIQKIIDSIRLAQTAPSACNRQATRVHILKSKEAKEFALSIQNGNRGFGSYADMILLVTSDMSNWSPTNKNLAYIDAGIFTMNLLYALHYYNICACPLNANMDKKAFKELHKRLNIPFSEIPACFVTVGNAPEHFTIPMSARLKTSDIYSII